MSKLFPIRFKMTGSLRSQLLIRSCAILAILLLLIGILQYWLTKDFLYQNKAEALRGQVQAIPRSLLQPTLYDMKGRSTGLSAIPDYQKGPSRPFIFWPDISLAHIREDGTFQDLSEQHGIEAPQLTAAEYREMLVHHTLPRFNDYKFIRDQNGIEQLVIFRPIGQPGKTDGLLQIGADTRPMHDALMQQLLIFILLSCTALIAGAALYLSALRKSLIPLSGMVAGLKQIDAGKLDVRFPTQQGQLEIDRLSGSFNGMLERLEHAFAAERKAKENMQRFVADASHELRTPLTSIHGFLEVLLRGAASNPEQLQRALESMHGESIRINKLVADLLLLAKFDRNPQLQLTSCSLNELIMDMQPQLQILAKRRIVQFELIDQVEGNWDQDKLKQVILNLFQNAVQHTDPDTGHITISLQMKSHAALLAIQDNGSGIEEGHLPKLFDRFYRIDESRARQYGGAGLGLAITRSIVEAHNGAIHVRSQIGMGSVFSIALPLH